MLRIFFTTDDVARTRLAPAPDPLWETVLSLHILRSQRSNAVHGEWQRGAIASLQGSPLMSDLRLLLALNPPKGYFPDFLTPLAGTEGLDAGLDAMAATPREQLRRDLAILADERPLPGDATALARGDAGALRQLTDIIRAYHDAVLAPEWPRVEAVVEGDRNRRIRAVATRGAEGLLESLRPAMRWRAGELQVDYPFDQEMHLGGRGLLLVPSYFCWRYPVTLLDGDLPPVLVYPADPPETATGDAETGRRALGALVGSTRAAALAAIGDGCSTTDLARRVGISAGAASQHATVLRNAGLITSRRDRNMVLHSLTPLGTSVLNGR